jgi:hypothetical protein
VNDLVRALAFAYRRRGADVMERSRLLHMLTFDLRWFSPDPAKRLVARALAGGLLEQAGDELRPTFDVAAVDIPVNFRPREDLADAQEPIVAPPPEATPHVGYPVSADVARLVLARRRGEDVRERAGELRRRIESLQPPVH